MPHFTSRKTLFLLFSSCLAFLFLSFSAGAQVTISGGTGGEALCVGKPAVGLSNIVITESLASDFNVSTTQQIKLVPTSGSFEFSGSPSVSVSSPTLGNLTAAIVSFTTSQLVIEFTEVDNTNDSESNVLTISNLFISAPTTATFPPPGNTIERVTSGNDAAINGFGVGASIFTCSLASYNSPTAFNVQGGGIYCAGSGGVDVGLSNSEVGVSYQLMFGITPIGSPVSGTGSMISFGLQSTPGVYTVNATSNNSAACGTVAMTGSANVTRRNLPLVYNVQPSGPTTYCTVGNVTVQLSNSETGIIYELYNLGAPTGITQGGTTGSPINFTNLSAGNYSIVAYYPLAPICLTSMSGNVVVTQTPAPTITYDVTGGGTYCSGGTGLSVGLSGSQTGVSYQLLLGGLPTGTPVAGTGGVLDFGLQTAAGNYTVRATTISTPACGPTLVNGGLTPSVSITVRPLPIVQTVSAPGSTTYCAGSPNVTVRVNSSEVGFNYQLYKNAAPLGAPHAGTGAAIDFLNNDAGTYTIYAAYGTAPTCLTQMSGSVVVTQTPVPTITYDVTGGGTFCSGGAGLSVGLSGSQTGVSYQLLLGGSPTGTPVTGTGGALDFGLQTAGGNYTVEATTISTPACGPTAVNGGTTTNVSITVRPLPIVQTVLAPGSTTYCPGTPNVTVRVSSSEIGFNYQLYKNGVPLGAPQAGTGAAIDFLNNDAGTYTIYAAYGTVPNCLTQMSGSVVVTQTPAQTITYDVTGGGTYCAGGTGLSVGLSGSQTGVSYQLLLGGSPTGTPVTGTGGALDFGFQTAAGNYTVRATTLSTPACGPTLVNGGGTTNVTITVLPLPTVQTVSAPGSTTYCPGTPNVTVRLNNSETGFTYELYKNGAATGATIPGFTGSPLAFINRDAGLYTIFAYYPSAPSCLTQMSGSVVVTQTPVPTITYDVTGGGTFCSGGAGLSVGLSGSQTGVSYQLLLGGSPTGTPVTGTGGALDFGLQTAGGNYTVQATTISTPACGPTAVNGGTTTNVSITVRPLPIVQTVLAPGSTTYCPGTPNVTVRVSSSEIGFNYQLYKNGVPLGAPQAGTGAAIDFLNNDAGTYTIYAAYGTVPTCLTQMSGSVVVTQTPAPTITYDVTGGGTYCAGGTGLSVGLSGSQTGVSYQLLLGGSPTGTPVTGTGGALDFGFQTAAGNYTVRATTLSTPACGPTLVNGGGTTNVTIVVRPLPVVQTVSAPGSTTYCPGTPNVTVRVNSSEVGFNYQLYKNAAPLGAPQAGTGAAIDFLNNDAGTYTIYAAYGTAPTCLTQMSGSVVVTQTPAPTITFNVTGGGTYCSGGAGLSVGLSGSQAGVSYQLLLGGSPTGTPVTGTGGALDFGLQTVGGNYTVQATTISTPACGPTPVNGGGTTSVSITVRPLPVVQIVSAPGSTTYCAGTPNVTVRLNNSQVGFIYQLYKNAAPLGAPQAGTGSPIDYLNNDAGTYTVYGSYGSAPTCLTQMSGSVVVTQSPTPVLTVTDNTSGTICSDSQTSITLNDVVAPATISIVGITLSTPGGITGNSTVGTVFANGTTVADLLVNTTTAPQTIKYDFQSIAAGCSGTVKSVTVTVRPRPVYSVTNTPASICQGATTNVVLNSSTAGLNVRLANVIATGGVTGYTTVGTIYSAFPSTIADGLINPTTSAQTVTYQFEASTSGVCIDPVLRNVVVTVNPRPVGTVNAFAVCSDVALGGTALLTTTAGSVSASSYNITLISNPSSLVASAGAPVTGTGFPANILTDDAWTNTGTTSATITYSVVPVSSAGCLGSPFTVTITVNPEPVGVVPANVPVCSDVALGAGYTLTTTGGSVAATGYNITNIASGGLTASAGAPAVATNQPANVLTNDAWTNTGATPVNVIYTVVPVAATGCLGDPFTVTVTINPESRGWNDTRTVCSSASVPLGYDLQTMNVNVTGSGGNGLPSSFQWSAVDNPNVSGESLTTQTSSVINNTLVNVTSVDQTVVYTITPTTTATGCQGDNFTLTVVVKPGPVGVNQTVATCSSVAANYNLINNVAILGNNVGSTFSWVAAANAFVTGESTIPVAGPIITDVLTNVTNANQTVAYVVTPTGTNGCVGTNFIIQITVKPEPVGSIATAPTICSDNSVNYDLQANVNGNNGIVSNFSWIAASNSNVNGESLLARTGNIINDVLTNTTSTTNPEIVTYTVTPTSQATGCAGTPFTISVTVNARAKVDAGPDIYACENGAVPMAGVAIDPPSGTTWSGGTGSFSNPASPTSNYNLGAAEKNSTVILTLSSADPDGVGGPCGIETDAVNVLIYSKPTVNFTGLPLGSPPQVAQNEAPIKLLGNGVTNASATGLFTIVSPATTSIGSTFSDPSNGNVDAVIFDPAAATLGLNTIEYTFSETHVNTLGVSNVCTNFIDKVVNINPVTVIDFSVQGAFINAANEFEICAKTGLIKIQGFPPANTGQSPETTFTASTGFNHGGPMVINKVGPDYFIDTDAASLKDDVYTITYTFKNAVGATNTKPRNVRVFAAPTAAISVTNSCIASAIIFNDNSSITALEIPPPTIVSWKWDFADGSFSNLQNPSHFYGTSGNYNISLDVTTSEGCKGTATQSIRVGDVPVVDFGWSAICNNDSTKFTDKTNPGAVSTILSYTWDFGDGDVLTGLAGASVTPGSNSGRSSGTYMKPDHKYVAFGTFNAKLTVDTNDGCTNSLTQKVFILPYSTVTPIGTNAYMEQFEASNGGWIAEAKSPSDTSWLWTAPSGANINSAASGLKAWWTGRNSNTYYPNEQSVVNGPCFDLRQLKRPMVGLDYWSDNEANIDGGVLQYSVDGGVSWRIIGPPEGVPNRDQGINWFNGQGIPSNPGLQPLGNYGWTDKSGGWKNGRFNLDMIPVAERDQVRLRVAFASNGTNPPNITYDGFAFDNVFVGEKTRNVLVEHFTNSSSPPSVAGDTWVNDLYDQSIATRGVSDFYDIQYHVSIPNADQFNLDNPADPSARAIYFGVAQPPATIMDGILNNKFKGLYTDLDKTGIEVDRRSLVDPVFDLQLQELTSSASNKISVKLIATARKNINTPLLIQVALIENKVGSFRNILRKQLLGADGETITLAFATGNTMTKQYDDVDINAPIVNSSQLTLVAYIQDKNTKEIYQSTVIAAASHTGGVNVGLEEQVIPTTLNGITIYPIPANGSVYLSMPEDRSAEGFTWKLADERGVIVRAGNFDELVNNTRKIDVSGLANGVYIMMLSGPGKSVVHRKIIVMNRN